MNVSNTNFSLSHKASSQPNNLRNLISVQLTPSTRCSSVVTLAWPSPRLYESQTVPFVMHHVISGISSLLHLISLILITVLILLILRYHSLTVRHTLTSRSTLQTFDAQHCCHTDTAIKHRVPHWVKPSLVIFNIRALWHSDLSVRVPWCQKLQMTLNPVWHRMPQLYTVAVPVW